MELRIEPYVHTDTLSFIPRKKVVWVKVAGQGLVRQKSDAVKKSLCKKAPMNSFHILKVCLGWHGGQCLSTLPRAERRL